MSVALHEPPWVGRVSVRETPRVRITSATSILLYMGLAIVLVTALAFWGEERASRDALADFARSQSTLAEALAASVRAELAAHALGPSQSLAPTVLLRDLHAIERRGAVRVLLASPGRSGLSAADGSEVHSLLLEAAVKSGNDALRLSRAEAASLGLPSRTAIVALQRVDSPLGRYCVLVLATAEAERDRELRARWRLLLGLFVVAALVLGFGGLALRKQREQLELAHALILTDLRNQRDERLSRADKLATMGALATGIAHEVSTPLGVILGRAEQLLPRQTDERARRAVQTITSQIERIHAVIRGFLALARGYGPTFEQCAPELLVRNTMALVEHRFEKAKVRLASDVDTGMPRVTCEPRLFEQVLVNLLLNACDACSEGTLVTITAASEGTCVAFVVTDEGEGISADAAGRVTEPFFTTKPEGQGSGLGLAIANEIVKHHRGSLSLAARVDAHGTCAKVLLPASEDVT
jgi:two-component system NtrC family sensor kinase